MGYLNDFLSLDCYNDVLNAVGIINNKTKEISESMAIIKQLKKIILNTNDEYVLYDLCAGNALTSVTASHLFKLKNTIAYDIKERIRSWELVKRFKYINIDIYDDYNTFISIKDPSIIIGVHACTDLAKQIIEIYNHSNASHLILMPCCREKVSSSDIPKLIQAKIGGYLAWCYYLSKQCEGKVKIVEDKNILSPCNCIIIAHKY